MKRQAEEMNEVPKIVRDRLEAAQRAAQGEVHPDADVLAAFAERALHEDERQKVLAHLAKCPECREVVSLAAPVPEDTQIVVRPVRKRWWFLQPAVLRWGAVAASLVIVAVAVMRYAPQKKGQISSYIEASKTETKAAAPAAATAEKPAEQETAQSARENAPAREKTTTVARSDTAGHPAETPAQESAFLAPSAKGAAPTRDNTQVVAGVVTTEQATPAAATVVANNGQELKDGASQPAATGVGGGAPLAKARKAAAPQKEESDYAVAADKAAAAPAPPAPAAQPLVQNQQATSAATVGETVEVAPQTAEVVQSQGLASKRAERPIAVASQNWRWSVTDDGQVAKLESGRKWTKVAVAKHVRFSSISASGEEIWAGGGRGALYHSVDEGKTWQHVTSPTDEDIARVDFSDALHGTITTKSGAKWTTTDGGATWTKQ